MPGNEVPYIENSYGKTMKQEIPRFFFKKVKGMNRHFSKEDIQMANKAHEKMLNTLSHQGNRNQNHNDISLHTY